MDIESLTVDSVTASDDLVTITGTAVVKQTVGARGHLSAMMQHYDPDQYWPADAPAQTVKDDDGNTHTVEVAGHLRSDAVPREMTAEEKLAYCRQLLIEQNDVQAPVTSATDLGISG